jgi:hypothetical protein
VDAAYAAAIKAGGTGEGEPADRTYFAPGYYAANVADFDGNRLEFVRKAWNPREDNDRDRVGAMRAVRVLTAPAALTVCGRPLSSWLVVVRGSRSADWVRYGLQQPFGARHAGRPYVRIGSRHLPGWL